MVGILGGLAPFIPLPPGVFDSGFDELTYTRFPHAHIRIVVDDGTVIPRRKLRLKRLGRFRYISDLSLVPVLTELLHFPPENFIMISDVPDVEVRRTPRSSAPAKVIDSRPWAYKMRSTVYAGNLASNTPYILHHSVQNIVAPLGILYLTEKEAERHLKSGKVLESSRVDLVLGRWAHDPATVKLMNDISCRIFVGQRINMYGSRANVMAEVLGIDITVPLTTQDKKTLSVFAGSNRSAYDHIQLDLDRKAERAAKRYPLLFDSGTSDTYRAYVAMVDSAELEMSLQQQLDFVSA
jgi:hypothetical protein